MGKMHREFGPTFAIKVPNIGLFMDTIDANEIEFIFNSQFDNVERMNHTNGGSWRVEAFFGDGIFTSNGMNWKQQRGASRAFFKIDALRAYLPIFHEKSLVVCDKLAKVCNTRESIDVQDLFMKYTLVSICFNFIYLINYLY
jgi:cytochrome P450